MSLPATQHQNCLVTPKFKLLNGYRKFAIKILRVYAQMGQPKAIDFLKGFEE